MIRETISHDIGEHRRLRRLARQRAVYAASRGWTASADMMLRYARWDTWRIRNLIATARRLAQ